MSEDAARAAIGPPLTAAGRADGGAGGCLSERGDPGLLGLGPWVVTSAATGDTVTAKEISC